jgi:ATP-dependent protease HslVU (ClpYQ) peptidase subunit
MKVICRFSDFEIERLEVMVLLQNSSHVLTYNSIYDVIQKSMNQYLIIDDTGNKRWYNINRFILLEEERARKLKQLGI